MEGFDPTTSFGDEESMRYDAVDTRGDEEQTVAFLARLAGGRDALELAVGTGRIALPLAASGMAWRLYPFAAIGAVWWLLADRQVLRNEFVLPHPADVMSQIGELGADGSLADDAGVTLRSILTAFALAAVVGIPLGAVVGRSPLGRRVLRPVLALTFPVPKIALYPAMTIVFGLGTSSKVALGFAEALFPILFATAAGTAQVAPPLVWSAASLGTPRHRLATAVLVPAALPSILTGARIALVGATIGVFLGEMIVGAHGLGHLMAVSYRTLETRDVYVAVVTISAIGLTLDRTLLLARRRLLTWTEEEDA